MWMRDSLAHCLSCLATTTVNIRRERACSRSVTLAWFKSGRFWITQRTLDVRADWARFGSRKLALETQFCTKRENLSSSNQCAFYSPVLPWAIARLSFLVAHWLHRQGTRSRVEVARS